MSEVEENIIEEEVVSEPDMPIRTFILANGI